MRQLRQFLVFALLLAISGGSAFAREPGYAAFLMDAESGKVLTALNADTQLYPASLTKMMTAYLLFEALDVKRFTMSSTFPISKNAVRQQPTKIGLQVGQRITVEDALQAIITRSANDIAVAVAEGIAGNEAAFARRMTLKARELGMSRTTFRNASGLPNREQISTARDMAILARRLMVDFPHYYPYFSQSKAVVAGRTITSHNRLLDNYPGSDGMKTGYIDASGFNLVASAVRDERRLIGVIFGGKTARSRDLQMVSLFDNGFKRLGVNMARIGEKGVIHFAKATPKLPPVPRSKPESVGDLITAAEARPALPEVLPPAPPVVEAAPPVAVASEQEVVVAEFAPDEGAAQAPALNRSWSVQVGAYRDEASALIAITDVTRQMPLQLGPAVPRLTPVESPMGKLYRAQLLGLAEVAAKTVCDTLTKGGRHCLPVPPTGVL